jgi:peptidoglycan/LPS O-acetylase OafA/YrhL
VRAAEPSWLMRGLSWKPFVGLGVISYGVYLFHLPVIYAVRSLAKASSVEFQMVFDSLFLIAAATLSYHVLEKPIRRYGVRGALQQLFGP